ncbi:hypothetical protein HK101_001917, partial [Irineochytrium annulatum]
MTGPRHDLDDERRPLIRTTDSDPASRRTFLAVSAAPAAPSEADTLTLHLSSSDDDDPDSPSTVVPPKPLCTASDESTPLLSRDQRVTDFPRNLTLSNYAHEARELIPYAWPVSLGYFLQMSLNLTAIYALGRVSTHALASMTLSSLFANVTGFSIVIGMASGLDTLCSQAYGEYMAGRIPKTALGRHLNRGMFILMLMSVPIAIMWCFTEPLLLLAGQDREIAALSAQFTRCLIPGLFPYVVAESMKRFLAAQGIMCAPLRVILIVAPTNALLQYLFVWSPWAIGPIGSPIALSVSNFLMAFLLYLYVRNVAGGDAWLGFDPHDLADFRQLWLFVKLGAPDVLMVCSEWWAFEVLALFSGILGPQYLAAQTIVLNASSLMYMIPLGLSISATTRIGNALGAGLPFMGKASAWTALSLGLTLAVFQSSTLYGVKDVWGYVWTTDEEVVAIVAKVLPLVALFQLSDANGAVSGGILRGIGRQDIGGILNVCGYYVVGLPLSYFACFHLDWKLFGLWSGLTAALIAISLIQVVIISTTDWAGEAENAHKRVGEGPG